MVRRSMCLGIKSRGGMNWEDLINERLVRM